MEKVYLYSEKDGWFNEEGLFLFDKPIFSLEYKNKITYLNGKPLHLIEPLILIEKIVKDYKVFAVGYISYNYGEDLVLDKKFPKKDDINIPEIYFLFFKGFKKIKVKNKNLKQHLKNLKFNTPKDSFIKKVLKAKKYIENGDIYQVNLTHRIDLEGFFYPEEAFYRLINIQKTPYLMFLKTSTFSIISASMELFLEKKGNILKTKPIKGTRPRGKNKKEDITLYNELKNSSKEVAENLMITDLMRNDLGRISKKVYVSSLFEIEKYSTLYQMSSTVKGILKENLSLKNIIGNTFPPGSVTGAPKKRAMEIINELEDKKRSVYCGATVLIKPNLDFIMSVAIRQSIFKNNKCYIYVGSGITYYSNPEDEYKETLIKAKANLKSLGIELDI